MDKTRKNYLAFGKAFILLKHSRWDSFLAWMIFAGPLFGKIFYLFLLQF